jgi:hypothetical protein
MKLGVCRPGGAFSFGPNTNDVFFFKLPSGALLFSKETQKSHDNLKAFFLQQFEFRRRIERQWHFVPFGRA